MRIRRRIPLVLAVLLVAATVALVVVLRKHAPPEAARLLPGADGFMYINLRAIRRANISGQLPSVSYDPAYEQFIQATGFQFERDLDEAAFAFHYPAASSSGTGGKAEARQSEVFTGKIQGDRLRGYLHKVATSVENYASTDIYNIPMEGHTFRVAILGVDTVAASDVDDPGVMQGIIDRSRKLASPFGGPAFLRKYYKKIPITTRYVPFASLAWAIFRVDPAAGGADASPMSMAFLFAKPAVVVASARAFSGIQLRAEAFTDSEQDARHVTQQLTTFLTIFHSAEGDSGKNPDPDLKQFFDSLKVEQNGDRAVLTAIAPVGLIRKITQTDVASPAVKKP